MSFRMTVDQTNRTFICSVVFVDLVDYSKKSVVEQLAIKDHFTAQLAEGLKDVAVNDRIVLDTGDGAAMSFLGDPEDALFVGMSLRDAMKALAAAQDGATGMKDPCSIRIGINLGPIKLVRDINGQPNIVGDGINVAQRIMSFAQPGQILVSRSYYDVVSCLSDEYGKLFSYDGSRTDKHVREHDVYVVGESESAFIHAKTGMENRAAQTNPRLRLGSGGTDAKGGSGTGRFSAAAISRAAIAFLQDRKKVMIAGGVLGAVIVLLGVMLVARKPAPLSVQTAAAPAAGAPAQTEPSAKEASAEKAEAPAAPQGPAKAAGAKPESRKSGAAEAGVAPGTVHLAIAPWGEVYVNGKSRGVSPPIKSLKLPPGKYKIEIRNTTFAPRTEVVEVKSRKDVTIKQVFK